MDILRDYAPNALARYAFARHALVDALSNAGVTSGSTVALPAFICRDVLASIHALGAQPDFYEVDEALRPRNLASNAPSSAILAVNYFGFPQDLAPFREFCDQHGAQLIEDNAHGLFSRDRDGQLLGTRGDWGILSMRKSFHVSTGAALIAPPGTDLGPTMHCQNGTDAQLDRIRFVVSRSERKTSLPLMPAMRSTIRALRRLAGKPDIELSSTREEFELPKLRAIGCTSSRVLDTQQPSHEATRRRELFTRLIPEIGGVSGVSLLHDGLADGVVPYGLPFRANSDAAISQVAKIARRYHVTTMTWPSLPAVVEADAPPHYRDVWLVNFI